MKKGLIITLFIVLLIPFVVADDLNIKKIKATVRDDEGTSRYTITEGKSVDVRPDGKIEFEFELENTFDRDSDQEITDVLVTLTIDEIDDGDDFEDDTGEFDIKEGDSETEKLSVDVPLNLDDETYDATIEIEWSINNTDFSETIDFEIDIDKNSHEVIAMDPILNPGTINCGESANLVLEYTNIGRNDEKVDLSVKNLQLGVNIEDSFTLDENPDDSDNSIRRTFPIRTKSDSSGRYIIEAVASYKKDDIKLRHTKTLEVKCEQKEESKASITTQITPEPVSVVPISGQAFTQPKPIPQTSNNQWIFIVILAEITLIIIGAIVLISLRRK